MGARLPGSADVHFHAAHPAGGEVVDARRDYRGDAADDSIEDRAEDDREDANSANDRHVDFATLIWPILIV